MKKYLLAAILVGLVLAGLARAWWVEGHGSIAEAATAGLPADMPRFIRLLQKGIHAKIDAFPERRGLTAEEISRGLKAKKIDDVWDHVVARIHESHELVGKCYEMDSMGVLDKPTRDSRQFIFDRCRAGAQFTMDLWYTAWLRSANMPKHY